ncbi:MAG: Crp/Fnr family transcriptional regulator [Vallitaleaceae bacterium]|jgi:CRP/FNR family transcriptional regulator|nr:Crp/Fnr family transcriptional regulator [Vallitaleaceae bacterium]
MEEIKFVKNLKSVNQALFNSVVSLDAGTEILNENDQCGHVLFLLSGEIEVYKTGANGRVFNLYTIEVGESCVLNLSCILSGSTYLAYARAKTDIKCIMIPRNEFITMFSEEEVLRQYVFELISKRLIFITEKVESIVLDSLENRLRELLLGKPSTSIYMTHDEIANNLGTAREVVSRQLKKWENDGLIELHRGMITLIKL